MRVLGDEMTEARWTPPTDWNQHPHDWHSDDADVDEHEVTELVAAFVRALQPEIVVETGCNTGQTSEAIGRALLANGHGWLLTCDIDPVMLGRTDERCKGLPVTVLEVEGEKLAMTGPIDFLWLDSDLFARHREFNHFRDHLAPGAVIGVHDTGPQHPVHGTFEPYGLTGLRLRTPRGVSFYQCS